MANTPLPLSSAAGHRSEQRPRMTRRELWNFLGVSACVWVMVFAFIRMWWRIYSVASQ